MRANFKIGWGFVNPEYKLQIREDDIFIWYQKWSKSWWWLTSIETRLIIKSRVTREKLQIGQSHTSPVLVTPQLQTSSQATYHSFSLLWTISTSLGFLAAPAALYLPCLLSLTHGCGFSPSRPMQTKPTWPTFLTRLSYLPTWPTYPHDLLTHLSFPPTWFSHVIHPENLPKRRDNLPELTENLPEPTDNLLELTSTWWWSQ